MSTQFARLDTGTLELRDGFSLNTRSLETQMMLHNGGIDIGNPQSIRFDSEAQYMRFVPFFPDPDLIEGRKLRLAQGNTGPCSMLVDSTKDLAEHMSIAYQVAHYNYILGANKKLNGSFPINCCSMASSSVMVSLMAKGYPNVAYARNEKYDHSYVVLPFVFDDKIRKFNGSIVIDPTYDQLFGKELTPERNKVFLREGSEWEYITGWKNGANLFPDLVCSIDIQKRMWKEPKVVFARHIGGRKYFKKAFANPVNLSH